MTHADMLQQQLASWLPSGLGRHEWLETSAYAPWTVRLIANQVEKLGCELWEAQLTRSNVPWTNEHELKRSVEAIAGHAKGLLEPLDVYELDSLRLEAILRSKVPLIRGDDRFYYEVCLHGGNQILLRRYHARMSVARREQVPFVLTHEALALLLESMMTN